jgi:putative SOS response-associated peptidase YedK
MKSFTLVTTKGNELLTRIHNNPKLKEPRMPFLLSDDLADYWLSSNENKDDITSLIQPYPTHELTTHTVRRLRGKEYMGKLKEISEPFEYANLEI